jgi:hypothetical protein
MIVPMTDRFAGVESALRLSQSQAECVIHSDIYFFGSSGISVGRVQNEYLYLYDCNRLFSALGRLRFDCQLI